MGLQDDLSSSIRATFAGRWSDRDGRVVPEPDAVTMGNDAVKLDDAVVLYADLSESTNMVDSQPWYFAAEIYKAFLHCAAKVIKAEGGTVTAYDGDRVMAVYLGDYKNTSAARTALKLNYCRLAIIQPLIDHHYPNSAFKLKHVVGIDRSPLRAARTGVRGSNDLVWVGTAANHAAKLTSLSDEYPTWISGEVYDRIDKNFKEANGQKVWEERVWNAMNRKRIYRSTWWLKVDA